MPRRTLNERLLQIDEQMAALQAKLDALQQKKDNMINHRTWTDVRNYAKDHGYSATDVMSMLAAREMDDNPQVTPRPRRRRRTKAEMEAARAAAAAAEADEID